MKGERFAIVGAQAITDDRISPQTFRVFSMLCLHANEEGYAWPADATLAKALGISRTTIVGHVATLTDCGYIQVAKRDGRTRKIHVLGGGSQFLSSRLMLAQSTSDVGELAVMSDQPTSDVGPADTEQDHRTRPSGTKPKNRDIDEEFIQEMIALFGEKLGGETKVRETIEYAINHTSSRKWINKRFGVRGWLRRDADQGPRGGSNGGSRRDQRPAAAGPNGTAERIHRPGLAQYS